MSGDTPTTVDELVSAALSGFGFNESRHQEIVNRLRKIGVSDENLSAAILIKEEHVADLLKELEVKLFIRNLRKC